MTPELLGEAVVDFAFLAVFLGILGIGALIADYVFPHIPFIQRYLDRLPDYEDDEEVERQYREELRQRRIARQRRRASRRGGFEMSDLKKSIDRKVEELSQKIGETGCWQARKVIELRHYIANSDVDDIIKFVPTMIEELADAQRRLVAMHDQIRLLVWLGKEEN